MNKKIIIFGSNGYLAKNLIHRFKDNNTYIKINSKKDKSYIVDDELLIKIFKNNDFDIILNCVGLADIDLCEKNLKLALDLNYKFPKKLGLFSNIYKKNIKIIHISTDQFYDGFGFKKEDEVNINNNYTKSKYKGEEILSKYNPLIFRTNFIGRSYDKDKKGLSDFFYQNLNNNKYCDAFNDIYFNPLSFETLSKVIEKSFSNNITGTFNLGSRGSISKYDLGLFFAKKLNKEKYLRKKSSEEYFITKRSKNMTMNINLFENKFEYNLPNISDELNQLSKEYSF